MAQNLLDMGPATSPRRFGTTRTGGLSTHWLYLPETEFRLTGQSNSYENQKTITAYQQYPYVRTLPRPSCCILSVLLLGRYMP